jgi:hypothetical protein
MGAPTGAVARTFKPYSPGKGLTSVLENLALLLREPDQLGVIAVLYHRNGRPSIIETLR